jgi:Protein of unknown function (DUF3072)
MFTFFEVELMDSRGKLRSILPWRIRLLGSPIRRCRRPRLFCVEEEEIPPAMQNPEKDPQDWTTGDEPMTGPQRSYLQTLCREAGEEFNDKLTKAEASKKIDELQKKTGRGK